MFRTRTLKVFILFMCVTILPNTISAYEGDGVIEPGESETDELAKATQNPVADLISLPFQNNLNFDVGPREKTQNVLNIQPVWPVHWNEDWNLITVRTGPYGFRSSCFFPRKNENPALCAPSKRSQFKRQHVM